MKNHDVKAGDYTTRWLEKWLDKSNESEGDQEKEIKTESIESSRASSQNKKSVPISVAKKKSSIKNHAA